MDNHPIPQDVTGFQFRLIGNMTVKQFAYIAVGAVGAVIIFYLPLAGLFTLVKILLIPLFILGGICLAFVPIEGRPIDIMASNFLRALFSPNQFIYHRTGGQLLLSTIHISPKIASQANAAPGSTPAPQHTSAERQQARQQQLAAYLTSLQQNQAPDDKEASRVSALFGPTAPTVSAAPITQQPSAPTQPVPAVGLTDSSPVPMPETPVAPILAADGETAVLIQKDTEKLAEDEALIARMNAELVQAKSQVPPTPGATPAAGPNVPGKVSELEQKLQELTTAKAQLEQELQSLKQSQPQPKADRPLAEAPQPAAPAPVSPAQAVTPAKGSFPSLPDSPNILLGIVRDSSGNVLPNILVEVTDSEGNPVRAFKTNQLGQFMSATQLKEGSYTVNFEDTKNQYKFDPAPVSVTNQIMQPLEIAAHDAREELRKSLFA